MISVDTEFYSSPYYFLIRDKGDKYSLYFSVEETLTEARKKDEVIHFDKKKGKKVKNYLEKTVNDKKKKSTKTLKTDLEELVNSDGAMSNSAIPILDPKLHPKKTMDQTIAAARITNDPIARGYRTYYGESVEEIEEIDMSGAFGYEETEDMDGKDTFEYLVNDMGMEPEDAEERTKQKGQDPTGKKDKKSPYYKDPNFINNADVNKKELETSRMLKRNLLVLKKQAEKEGISVSELIKMLKSE